ncbi:MAG: hypothetical protein GY938_08860, partial [Ketobacter sp.]|nr:hypothetical protein [Ketobacter sp.]
CKESEMNGRDLLTDKCVSESVLREEPCTDPYARFCGQTEAAASSDPIFAGSAAEMLGFAELTPTYDLNKYQHKIRPTLANPHRCVSRSGGLKVEATKVNLLRVAAHVVNGGHIAFVQEAGCRAWWNNARPLSGNIELFDRFEDVDLNRSRAVLWVTRRTVNQTIWERLTERLVVYRPPRGQAE